MLSVRLREGIWRNVGRLLGVSWYYYIVAIGITSHRLELRTCFLHRSKGLACYCVCANALALLFLPLYCYCESTKYEGFANRPMLHFIYHLALCLQSLSMVYIIGTRCRKDRRFLGIVQQLQTLETQFFGQLQSDCGHSYEWLLLAKYLAFCCQSFRVFLSLVVIMRVRKVDWLDHVLHLYYITMWNTLHSNVLLFFIAVLHISKRFHILNSQLQQLLKRQQLQDDVLFLEQLRSLLRLHRRLRNLLTELSDVLGFHLLILLVVNGLGISTMGYVYFVFVTLPAFEHSLSLSLSFLLAYFVYNLDILLLHICCGRATRMHAEIAHILRESPYIGTADVQVQRTCEDFILNLVAVDFHVRICGMFALDKRTALVILQSSLMHTIILIQSDIMFSK